MPKSACATLGFGKDVNLLPCDLFVAGDNHLCDTLSIFYDKIFARKINQDYADFAPIVCINCARSIQHADATLDGKSATGAHLCFVAGRQGDVEPCRHQATLEGTQDDGLVEIRPQVHTCR